MAGTFSASAGQARNCCSILFCERELFWDLQETISFQISEALPAVSSVAGNDWDVNLQTFFTVGSCRSGMAPENHCRFL